MAFEEIAPQLITDRIIETVGVKNLETTLQFVDFSEAFSSIHREKKGQIFLSYGLRKETVIALMMLYKNSKAIVRSSYGDTKFFDIITGILHQHHISLYSA